MQKACQQVSAGNPVRYASDPWLAATAAVVFGHWAPTQRLRLTRRQNRSVERVIRLAYSLTAALLLSHLAEAQQSSSTISVVVSNQVDTTSGINGRLQMAMSTSFQLMGSGDQFFNSAPQATVHLNALAPAHTRV
jgi:hypothetical protein